MTALPRGELAAFAEAMFLVMLAAPLVRFVPLRRLRRLAEWPLGQAPDSAAETIARVIRAIGRAARRSPFRALCFERGLAAQIMLRRRGIDSTLIYGVSPSRGDRKLAAHVWIRIGEQAVLGGQEAADYTAVASFPPRP